MSAVGPSVERLAHLLTVLRKILIAIDDPHFDGLHAHVDMFFDAFEDWYDTQEKSSELARLRDTALDISGLMQEWLYELDCEDDEIESIKQNLLLFKNTLDQDTYRPMKKAKKAQLK